MAYEYENERFSLVSGFLMRVTDMTKIILRTETKQSRIDKSQAGFTLIEMIIVVVLTAALFLGFLLIYDWYGKNYQFQQAQIMVTGQARASLDEIQEYTLQASEVVASHVIGGNTYTSGNSVMVLKIPAINSDGIPITNTWDYVAFSASGGSLAFLISPDPASSRNALAKQLSNSIYSLSFTYNSANFPSVSQVTVNLETRQQIRTGPVRAQVNQVLQLRNR